MTNRKKPEDTPSDDYEVGYGKPPKHTRFQKGQSGNPKGRPKNSKNLGSVFVDMLKSKVTVKIDGEPTKKTMQEALVYTYGYKALQTSDLRALNALITLAKQTGQLTPEEDKPKGGVLVVPGMLSEEEWNAKYVPKDDDDEFGTAGPYGIDPEAKKKLKDNE